MPLHPQCRAFLDACERDGAPMPWEAATVADARSALAELFVAPREPIPVGAVEERAVPIGGARIQTRIFKPAGEGPFPILLWFHGGGWVVGSLDESDTVCRSLCSRAGAIVLCPDYRMAPEHRFPVAAEDCYAIAAWAAETGESFGGDPSRIAVAGDSAGGNLAAVVALMARDRSGPELVFQVLVYPVVGLPADGRRSYEEFAEGFFLTRHGMEWFAEQYIAKPEDRENPYLSPLRAAQLGGLPPALVITAEYDPLTDEGAEYARRLEAGGTPCTFTRYYGMIHAFFVLPDQFDEAFKAHDEVANSLRNAFSRPRAASV